MHPGIVSSLDGPSNSEVAASRIISSFHIFWKVLDIQKVEVSNL